MFRSTVSVTCEWYATAIIDPLVFYKKYSSAINLLLLFKKMNNKEKKKEKKREKKGKEKNKEKKVKLQSKFIPMRKTFRTMTY